MECFENLQLDLDDVTYRRFMPMSEVWRMRKQGSLIRPAPACQPGTFQSDICQAAGKIERFESRYCEALDYFCK